MFVLTFLLIIVATLAVAYASFATGLLCARNRQLRLVFVRVMALLGMVAACGVAFAGLRIEPLAEDDSHHREVAEAMFARYSDVGSLLAVSDVVAEEQDVVDEIEEAVEFLKEQATEGWQTYGCNSTHAQLASFAATSNSGPPDWIGQPLMNKGQGDHTVSVFSDPWVTDVEASSALDTHIYQAVVDYVDDQIGRRGAARRIGLGMEDIREHDIIVDVYSTEGNYKVGAMKERYAKLVFTPDFRAHIAQRWQEHLVAARLVKTGVGAFAVMVLLFVVFGALKRVGAPT